MSWLQNKAVEVSASQFTEMKGYTLYLLQSSKEEDCSQSFVSSFEHFVTRVIKIVHLFQEFVTAVSGMQTLDSRIQAMTRARVTSGLTRIFHKSRPS